MGAREPVSAMAVYSLEPAVTAAHVRTGYPGA